MPPRASSFERSSVKRFPWRWVLGGLISLLCMLVLLSRVEVAHLVREFSRIDPRRLIIPTLLGVCFFPVKVWRWQLLFPRTQRPGHRDCFAALALSNLINNLVPARGGDLVRCLLVKKGGVASASVALATVAFEKVFDGLTLVFVLLLAILLLGTPGWVMMTALIPGAVFAGTLAFLITLRLRSSLALRFATRCLELCRLRFLKERGLGLLSRFIDGLGVIESRGQILAATALTAVIWFGDAVVTCWLCRTMNVPLTLGAAAVMSAIVGLGFMIPAGPAAVGPYEAATVAALGLFNVHGEQALAVALVLHGCTFALTTGLGIVGMVLAAGNVLESPSDQARPGEREAAHPENASSPVDRAPEAPELAAALGSNGPALNFHETAAGQNEPSQVPRGE